MPTALETKAQELEAKQKAIMLIWEEAGEDLDMSKVTLIDGDSAEKVAEIQRLTKEMNEVGEEVEELRGLTKAAEDAKRWEQQLSEPVTPMIYPGGGMPGQMLVPQKGFGQMFTESPAFKDYKGGGVGPVAELDINLKALFQTTAGWAPETTRTGRFVEDAQRPIQVLDLYPTTTTIQQSVVYMEETTFTDAAAERAEAAAYAEATLAVTEQSSPVRSIGVSIPVTDEQLDDEPRVSDYLDNRLIFMVRRRLDTQTLVGDGVAPNLTGILNVAGIQTQAKGADPTPDAVYKAMDLVRVTGRAIPTNVILHPNDWQAIRLLRTSDGQYIWGSPAEAGPARIWGIPVTLTDAITENTGLVGDFPMHSELAMRQGVDVQITNTHSTDFINGRQMIRAGLRVAFVIYRPAAFCTITGI